MRVYDLYLCVIITSGVDHPGDGNAFFRFIHPIEHHVALYQKFPVLVLQRPDGDIGGICVGEVHCFFNFCVDTSLDGREYSFQQVI